MKALLKMLAVPALALCMAGCADQNDPAASQSAFSSAQPAESSSSAQPEQGSSALTQEEAPQAPELLLTLPKDTALDAGYTHGGSFWWELMTERWERPDMDCDPALWTSAGWMEYMTFEDAIEDLSLNYPNRARNHCGGYLEQVLENGIALWQENFDVYVYEGGDDTTPDLTITNYWCLAALEKDGKGSYFLFLNQECYSREEAVEIGLSMEVP